MSPITENSFSNPILQIVVPLLDSHLTTILSFLWRLGKKILRERISPSDYEILEYDAQLELLDDEGKHAIFAKRERVRFLQNNIIAYQDLAWGVGNIFASYSCTPGVAVDCYREGHRHRILISLRETKNRGDTTEFHIRREITDGFTAAVEDFQHEINHVMQRASLSLIFPETRHPRIVRLIEQNSTRSMILGAKYRRQLPDGRLQITWTTQHPRLFEAYILQ